MSETESLLKLEEHSTPPELEATYRHNVPLFLADNILFNVAFNIIGPSTFLPDFVRQLTNSEVLIGFSSSLFTAGTTLPQLGVARLLRGRERVKRWYILPNIPAHMMILLLAGALVVIGAGRPTALLAAFFICYSLAAFGNGISNLPWWTMAASSLDARWRARVIGLTELSAGLILILLLPLIGRILGSPNLAFPNNYALIFAIAGVLFVLALFPMLFVREVPTRAETPSAGETRPDGASVATTPQRSFMATLGEVLARDHIFRTMVVVRVLTGFLTMAAPFYIGFATVELGLSSTTAVPVLLAMQTVGMIAGAALYAWLGARSNTLVMRLAICIAPITPLCALAATRLGPTPLYIGFLISGLAIGNLLTSYQNWVIMWPAPTQRPVYAGLFNTIAAVVTLSTPLLAGVIVQTLGFQALFMIALVMGLVTLVLVLRRVPNVTA